MPHIIIIFLLSKSEKKKAQKKDRVYEHLQHQIAGQKAARRQGNKEKEKETVELFVDRQRQAAVVLGVRDIAGDNQAKRRREKSRRFLLLVISTFLCLEQEATHCLRMLQST